MSQQPTLEQHHWEQWHETRDSQAAEQLVTHYMPLVEFHVQRISVGLPSNVSKEELKSLGMVGLLDALWKFDPNRDLKFNTYASFRVRGAILDGLRKKDWLPRSVREKTKRIEATVAELEQKLMRKITVEDIAKELEMPEKEVLSTLQDSSLANVILIDEHHQTGEGESQFQYEDKKTVTPEQHVMKQERVKELSEAIKQLNENEQLVVSFFYEHELTLTEIGRILELSTSRISQIHSNVLSKLRNLLDDE